MTKILTVLALALLIQSCREGCKDKTALNYDSRATVENGNCQYCKSGETRDTVISFFKCFRAPDTSINSVEFILVVADSTVAGNDCPSIGKQPVNACYNYLTIVNLTGDSILNEFFFQFDSSNRVLWEYEGFLRTGLGPFDTLNFGTVSRECSNLALGRVNFIDYLTFH